MDSFRIAGLRDAEILAVNCVPLPKVVVRALPFQFTTEVETNPDPVTVSVKSELPALALVCDSEVTAGAGLLMLKGGGGSPAAGRGISNGDLNSTSRCDVGRRN